MRLKDADEPLGVRLARRRECHGNLRGMMRIVVYNPDAALLSLSLEAPLGAVELCKGSTDGGKLHAHEPCNSNTGKCIEHVVPPWDIKGNAAHLCAAFVNGKRNE